MCPLHGRLPGRRRQVTALTQGAPGSPAVAARTTNPMCSAIFRAGPGASSGMSWKWRRSDTNIARRRYRARTSSCLGIPDGASLNVSDKRTASDGRRPGLSAFEPVTETSVEVDISGRRLKLSNLDKVLWPQTGFTRGQMIDYYARIAPVMLRHVEGRPITLRRYPNGVDKVSFCEKNCPSRRPPWLSTVEMGGIGYCCLAEAVALVWTANLAATSCTPPSRGAWTWGNPRRSCSTSTRGRRPTS
jgi:hypothetical protein